MSKTTSYKTLRVCSRILSSIGILTFFIALASFCFIIFLFKVHDQYVSNTQQMGLITYAIALGAIFYFFGAIIPVLCDIADNTKQLADKEWMLPTYKEKSKETDHSKYLPKT